MKHEKTFETISKLKDIEIELHRLKNAREIANRALDAQRTWVGLTDKEIFETHKQVDSMQYLTFGRAIEAKLKEKNNG